MSKVKPLRNLRGYWIVVDQWGGTKHWTISGTRASSIRTFLRQTLTSSWPEAKKKGFRVVKVNVTFEEVSSKKKPLVMLAEYDAEVNVVIVSGEAETN